MGFVIEKQNIPSKETGQSRSRTPTAVMPPSLKFDLTTVPYDDIYDFLMDYVENYAAEEMGYDDATITEIIDEMDLHMGDPWAVIDVFDTYFQSWIEIVWPEYPYEYYGYSHPPNFP